MFILQCHRRIDSRLGNPGEMFAFASSFVPASRLAPRLAIAARRPPALVASRRRFAVVSAASNAGPIDVQPAIAGNRIMIFSKSRCPFCVQAKALLRDMGAEPEVWELDTLSKGQEIQAELLGMTGQRTVPNIFIGGEHIGGCDDLMSLHSYGELEQLIANASVSA